MPVTELPITNGFYKSGSLPVSAQECTNWYVRIEQMPAMTKETLRGTPGIRQLATSGVSLDNNRGISFMDGKPYFLNGETLYRLDENVTRGAISYSLVTIGTIAGTGRVSIANNGTQMLILIPGGTGYIYNKDAGTITAITDADFTTSNGAPQHVAFVDGYFVATTDTKKFIASALNNGLSWSALDFGTAESDPDPLVAPIVYKNELFIAGGDTIEGFQNVGGADFVFQRSGLVIEKGVYAPFSLVKTQDSFMFIGGGKNESPAIWMVQGNAPQKVSTVGIDLILESLTASQMGDVFAWSYSQAGHYFVGFALPTTTLVYDLSTQRWHERKSYANGVNGKYRVSGVVKAYNKILCGDMQDGRVGEITYDEFTEYGTNIVRVVASQPFQNNQQSMKVPYIELTVESGVGNDDAANPLITMDRSKDGKTWNAPRQRSLGAIGEYDNRVIWRQNGRVARFEILRFTLSDAVKPVIIQLTAEVMP